MPLVARVTKTFSLDRDVVAAIRRSKGDGSESERANRLLRAALERESREALAREAEAFFAAGAAAEERKERRAYQDSGARVWDR